MPQETERTRTGFSSSHYKHPKLSSVLLFCAVCDTVSVLCYIYTHLLHTYAMCANRDILMSTSKYINNEVDMDFCVCTPWRTYLVSRNLYEWGSLSDSVIYFKQLCFCVESRERKKNLNYVSSVTDYFDSDK